MTQTRVLFLCTGNSARSQMAQAFLRKYGGERFEAHSAGLEPSTLNPLTVQVMEEAGMDLSEHYAKPLTTYLGKQHFGYLITVCSRAEEKCPIFPGMGQRLHWPFDDPAAAEGTLEQRLAVFRRVRDEIEQKVQAWVASLPVSE
jgi:arsenate reductase